VARRQRDREPASSSPSLRAERSSPTRD
jgi:hypothetical protein